MLSCSSRFPGRSSSGIHWFLVLLNLSAFRIFRKFSLTIALNWRTTITLIHNHTHTLTVTHIHTYVFLKLSHFYSSTRSFPLFYFPIFDFPFSISSFSFSICILKEQTYSKYLISDFPLIDFLIFQMPFCKNSLLLFFNSLWNIF